MKEELSEPTPDSFYINGKKLYTEAYVQELEAKLTIAIDALEGIENATDSHSDCPKDIVNKFANDALERLK